MPHTKRLQSSTLMMLLSLLMLGLVASMAVAQPQTATSGGARMKLSAASPAMTQTASAVVRRLPAGLTPRSAATTWRPFGGVSGISSGSVTMLAGNATTAIFSDGFEGDTPPWQVDGTSGWAGTTYTASEGEWSAYCAEALIDAPGPYYDNMDTWLVAGPFDLSAVSAATWNFDLRLKSEAKYDVVWPLVSTDDSNFYGWGLYGDSHGWLPRSYDLTAVPKLGNVCGQSQVWVAYNFTSDASNVDEGAYVDNVSLSTDSPTPDDTVGPVCAAKNAKVKSGRSCRIYFKAHDAQSAQVSIRMAITTKSGVVKRRWSWGDDENFAGWWWTKYKCHLKRGTYRIVVKAQDLAGNPQSVVGRAKLVVK